jgi:hypothetical protein
MGNLGGHEGRHWKGRKRRSVGTADQMSDGVKMEKETV